MAKPPARTEGTSKIRFVVLEAEFPSGDMDQVTQAIQNALRPAVTIVQNRSVHSALPAASAAKALDGQSVHASLEDGDGTDAAQLEGQDLDGEVVAPPARRSSTISKPRSYKTPEVIDLDLKSEPSWESFSSARQPESTAGKYLVVAAWCKEARSIAAISADHVYTCFKAVKWSTSIKDFMAPFRALKHRRLMSTSATGEYIINHIGLDQVAQMLPKQ